MTLITSSRLWPLQDEPATNNLTFYNVSFWKLLQRGMNKESGRLRNFTSIGSVATTCSCISPSYDATTHSCISLSCHATTYSCISPSYDATTHSCISLSCHATTYSCISPSYHATTYSCISPSCHATTYSCISPSYHATTHSCISPSCHATTYSCISPSYHATIYSCMRLSLVKTDDHYNLQYGCDANETSKHAKYHPLFNSHVFQKHLQTTATATSVGSPFNISSSSLLGPAFFFLCLRLKFNRIV